MFYKRDASETLKTLASQFPVVALLGPRQSGKTTLAKEIFKNHRYISFEDLDMREFARTDPRKLLLDFARGYEGLILDEVQHVPSILSYIQTHVDEKDVPGFFVLTGSQNLMIHQAISQTLAGRMAILTLLPFSIHEILENNLENSLDSFICSGGYPRIYAKNIPFASWYSFYIQQYVERDVRLLANVHDLITFERFLKLCAGRVGQLLNVSSLANDCGISTFAARSWLSILQASYVIFLLPPYFNNISKRVIKSPKLYFYDTGIACSLMGIKNAEQLTTHYAYGSIFESLIISELFKLSYNRGETPSLYFYRDGSGAEVDCIIEQGTSLTAVEIKAGRTIYPEAFKGIEAWNKIISASTTHRYLVYGGDENQSRSQAELLSWRSVHLI